MYRCGAARRAAANRRRHHSRIASATNRPSVLSSRLGQRPPSSYRTEPVTNLATLDVSGRLEAIINSDRMRAMRLVPLREDMRAKRAASRWSRDMLSVARVRARSGNTSLSRLRDSGLVPVHSSHLRSTPTICKMQSSSWRTTTRTATPSSIARVTHRCRDDRSSEDSARPSNLRAARRHRIDPVQRVARTSARAPARLPSARPLVELPVTTHSCEDAAEVVGKQPAPGVSGRTLRSALAGAGAATSMFGALRRRLGDSDSAYAIHEPRGVVNRIISLSSSVE